MNIFYNQLFKITCYDLGANLPSIGKRQEAGI